MPPVFATLHESIGAHFAYGRTARKAPCHQSPGEYGSRYNSDARILRAIVDGQHVDGNGRVLLGPNTGELAATLNVTERAVRFRLAALEAQGLIRRDRRTGVILTLDGHSTLQHTTKGKTA